MDRDETICFCGDVDAGTIMDAIAAGATTVEAVGEATGAGTHCGGCQDRIADIIEEMQA
ncbi:MAG: (2Fe-2S)-binding protein [Coriobacteriia bacterium]|nr:(2Fe-2S)-binding protein [Coriobacteriia bacterium]